MNAQEIINEFVELCASQAGLYRSNNLWVEIVNKREEKIAALIAAKLEDEATIKRQDVRHELDRHTINRWVPCADHRDKTTDGCYMCRLETVNRKLTAERTAREKAERALEEADRALIHAVKYSDTCSPDDYLPYQAALGRQAARNTKETK